jgi:hypothetical protein
VSSPQLDDLVSASPIVMRSPFDGARALEQSFPGSLLMMYGETFDDLGLPVDALKYYAWLAIVASGLASDRVVTANVLVADLAVAVNYLDQWGADRIADLAEGRVQVIRRFAALCHSGIGPEPVLMSHVAQTDAYKQRRAVAAELLESDQDFRQAVVGSVRADHLDDEQKLGFQYSLDEVALIAAYGVKIGPPREMFYDSAAQVLNKSLGLRPLSSVLLTPAFPLALTPGEFVKNRELREYGVTAYKAGSLGFAKNRIMIDRDTADSVLELATRTRLVRRPGAPNALTELARVLQLVQWAIEGVPPQHWLSQEWEDGRLADDELRREIAALYRHYIDSIVAPALAAVPRGL